MEVRRNVWFVVWALFAAAAIEVTCRQAVRPPADVEELVEGLDGLSIHQNDGSPCVLDIQKDLPKPHVPQPLYINPKTKKFWLPNEKGQMVVPRGSVIELRCDKSFANATDATPTQRLRKGIRILQASCLQDKTFVWRGQKFEFNQLSCSSWTKYRVERLNTPCATGNAQLYRVGYNVTASDFLETYTACHDDDVLRTHYVQFTLLPMSVHFQRYVKRLNFSKAGYFQGYEMNSLYSKLHQQQQANVLLSAHAGKTRYFDNGTFYLARGHLAAKADFIYATQQRSTFNFFNVAPQWQSFNGGQWQALEDEVRKFVARQQLEVDCYSGTWGNLQLPAGKGEREVVDFHLALDKNNNGILVVPTLYYRVLVTRQSPKRGIALVGVNNPHAPLKQILSEYVLCQDIHEEVAWLRWMRNNNLKKGYLYACRVPEFVEAIQQLPAHLKQVTEVLIDA